MSYKGGASYNQQIDQWIRTRIGPVAIPTGAAAIVGSAQKKSRVTNLHVANPTGGAQAVTIHILAVGESATAANVFSHKSVGAADFVNFIPDGNYLNLNDGDRIFMLSAGANLTTTVSIEEEK